MTEIKKQPERPTKNNMKKIVSVLLVHYGRPDFLYEALAALELSDSPEIMEIIVVDNGGGPRLAEVLPETFPGVRVLTSPGNIGFGRANNLAAAAARGRYLFFLNSDAMVGRDTIGRLLEKMEKEPDIGLLGPLLLNQDRSLQLSFGRSAFLWGEFRQRFLARRLENRRLGDPPARNYESQVTWLTGAALMARADLFPDGCFFDEKIFLYFEDIDLCLRVAELGYRVLFWSGTALVHYGGGSAAPDSPPVMVAYRRSQLYLYRKYRPGLQYRLLRLYLAGKCRLALARFKGDDQYAQARRTALKEILELLKEKG